MNKKEGILGHSMWIVRYFDAADVEGITSPNLYLNVNLRGKLAYGRRFCHMCLNLLMPLAAPPLAWFIRRDIFIVQKYFVLSITSD